MAAISGTWRHCPIWAPSLRPRFPHYAKPESIEEMVDHTVGRMLDLFEIDVATVRRWGEDRDLRARPVKS
jgi:hypothetical protein